MKKPEEIKKALKSCSSYECNGDHAECPYITSMTCVMDMANDALAYIDQIEQCLISVDKTCPEWISVNDMLPAYYRDVLVITRNGNELGYMVAHLGVNGVWGRNGGGRIFGRVTHWMPLPEPPKEDS